MQTFILSLLFFALPMEHEPIHLIVDDHGMQIEIIDLDDYVLGSIDPLFVDDLKLKELLNELSNKVYTAPINARIDKHGEVIPEVVGHQLAKRQFEVLFKRFIYSGEHMKIQVPKESIYPKISSELLEEISQLKLGSYVTYFKESNEERSHNIKLSTEAIHSHVLFSGEKFSFNEVVGQRTEDKGYKQAPVIVKGELTEDIGGGICQVSSTLFNAASLKGIQMVERYSHSRRVPYVPPGKDAAVSWWGPDFVFKNNYDHPILIQASSLNGEMLINIYSSVSVQIK